MMNISNSDKNQYMFHLVNSIQNYLLYTHYRLMVLPHLIHLCYSIEIYIFLRHLYLYVNEQSFTMYLSILPINDYFIYYSNIHAFIHAILNTYL